MSEGAEEHAEQPVMHSSFKGPPKARESSEDRPLPSANQELSVHFSSRSASEEDGSSNQAAARGDIDGRSSSRSPRNASDRGSSSSDDDFVKVDASEVASLKEKLRKSEEERLRMKRLLDIARTKIAELQPDRKRKDSKLDEKRRMKIRFIRYKLIRVRHKDLEFQIARKRLGLSVPSSLAEQCEHYRSAQDRPPIYLPPRPNHGREMPPCVNHGIYSSRREAECPNEAQEETPILHPTSIGASPVDTFEMSHPTDDEEQLAREERIRQPEDDAEQLAREERIRQPEDDAEQYAAEERQSCRPD